MLESTGTREDVPEYAFYDIFGSEENEHATITQAPALPATTLAKSCYCHMFRNCSFLVRAPMFLPAVSLAQDCYVGMFSGCTSLTQAPALPAITLVDRCYADMFFGCTSLVQAPALPATTLVNQCYYRMFYGCTHLEYMNVSFTDWSPANAT